MKNRQTKQLDLSVIVPVFNSYNSLRNLHNHLIKVLQKTFDSFEIIYILDGGTQREWQQLVDIQQAHQSHVNIIRLNKNFGQHPATYCGLMHSLGKFCVTIDDDLQFPPDEIPKMYEAIKADNLDLLYGHYGQNNQEWWRRFFGKIMREIATVVGKGFGKATSFRIIRRNLVDQLKSQFYSYLFLDEVFLQFTDKIGYIEVQHSSREKGESNYSFWSLVKLALTILVFHSSLAVKLVTYIGLAISTMVFVVILMILLFSLIGWIPLNSQLLFNSIIIFLLALILLSLGIISEYVKKIYAFSSFQPSFVIKEKIEASS